MSKELRRILSLVFALALLMSLALPACAEGKISAAGSDDAFEKEYTAEGSISGVSDDPFEAEPAAREIYVSADGDDMGRGSREEPLATLSAAADLANAAEGDTVYVILLSDLTITKTARFQGKNVILMSDEGSVLVSRGSGFETAAGTSFVAPATDFCAVRARLMVSHPATAASMAAAANRYRA